ncbi:cytochrome P450 2D15-like [Protopterus annectens]|uniref:cytochrome P450 2D15-like n=1 Tax=Protopterus annectens TaxID=7888 RepID=UPI001CFA53C1|nr:cytochrome P450 2D15-like [Protopterus annectens]
MNMEFLQNVQSLLQLFNSTGVIAVFLSVFVLLFDFMKRRIVWDRYPPGPRGLPFLGNMFQTGIRKPHLRATELSKKFGKLYSLQFGWENVVVVNGFDAVKELLIKKSEECADRPHLPFNDILGYTENNEGIIFARYGRSWKEQRRFILSTFRNFGLGKKSLEDKITEEAGFLCTEFQMQKGRPFDTHYIINNAVSNVICSMIFGDRFHYEDEKFLELLHLLEERLRETSGFWAQALNQIPWAIHFPGPHRKVIKVQCKIEELLSVFIKQHKETYDPSEKRDFIDAFLAKIEKVKDDPHTSFTERNLMFTTLDLFLAGTETTSTTLRWALLFMILYPDIQCKVHEEIDRVIGKGRNPSSGDRVNLPYTDAVIHEIQRYGEIVPFTPPRRMIQDVDIMGHFIPKGTIILVNLSSVLKDETVWEKPHEFYPENFLDNNGKFVKCDAFLAFSAGHRICLGEQLARLELFIFFTTLMQHFTFCIPDGEPKPSTDASFMITLVPPPFKICAKLR